MSMPPEFEDGQLLPLNVAHRWLKKCGANVRIYSGCRLVSPDRIEIGDHTQIDEGAKIFAGEGVVIGRYVHFAFNSSISGGGLCVIRDFVGIGAGVRIVTGTDVIDADGLTNPTVPDKLRTVRRDRVEVGAHAVVFTNSVVLPGVKIGEGAVVAAGSVVHHDLKPWAVYAGHPLVQVGQRNSVPVLEKAAKLLASRSE